MKLLLFEDQRSDFFPICQTRIVGDLRCGILKLRQRLEASFPADELAYLVDNDLVELYRERHPDWEINPKTEEDTLYLNTRLRFTAALQTEIQNLKPGHALLEDHSLIALRASGGLRLSFDQDELQSSGIKCHHSAQANALYRQLSDLIHDNDRLLRYDFEQFFHDKDNFFETEPGVTILNPYNVWLGEDVDLKPGVIIDASDGPVVIDEEAVVMHNSVIIGPCYIGKRSVIKINAKIYQSCSIGPVCKIGGEVEGSIIQAYSNKQHDGFLGHAYLGEWVNIGADTNNSDLKNTYKNVAIYNYTTKNKIDSGTQFMGCLIGDHVKLGINSTINTGAVIGLGSNLWGRNLISDYIPEFSWGEAGSLVRYRIEDFIQTAATVKARRKLKLGEAEIALFQRLFASGLL
jgi:UDP-N-acetylglucosamine diphosphorylase/glucosamine-1-phosphate N-acetyltransferase